MKHKKHTRGFTLVELMIVVAIVGVLAALAIYGVNKYVKNAKTAEARAAVSRLSKDATTAYARPEMKGDILTAGNSSDAAVSLCKASTKTVPDDKAKIAAKKYQSKSTDWTDTDGLTGWTCLRFSMSDPQYYMYGYAATVAGGAGDTFTATAQGDLDGDGDLSTFSIDGKVSDNANDRELLVSPNIKETSPDE